MKDDIERFLASAGEATAKTIATESGLPHLDVVKAISKMHADGTVEREKRAGGGNEYVYWLVRGIPPAHAAANEAPHAQAAPIAETPPVAPPVAEITVSSTVLDLHAEVERLTAENDSLRHTADTWRANCAALEARIDELTLGPVGAGAPMFVTVGRNSKPQRHDSLEKAQRRGRSLVRSEKESEVLVLEPVGRIVRGTEWMPR
ncbi:1-pyrroline-5-carboxylate dehydrogenase [Burkholderia stagnalis]|uniref:helix-turn-helix transcriptional regulator n=1 Tax=Burkholderia stagnalis TaxID=1503054 RepID=UPI000F5A8258|nr:1-pyrroline-5-carboxylate dehydrogenase [Burkholderia stagnalis]RQQ19696.1 1-pyrroline-5-carboxylate dehydrogenase [Burkholderia stagnalis]RQY80009.1 1-pyrroline-5-carboxylate dehydrogenase [Burkholderia stagnalis]